MMKKNNFKFFKFIGTLTCFRHWLILYIVITIGAVIPSDVSYSNDKGYHTIVFNLGEKDDSGFCSSWHDALSHREISHWGRSKGVVLNSDSAPVADGRARFVSKFGSIIRVSNLKSDRRYRLWIDFVTFQRSGLTNVISRLEIFMDRRLISTLRFGELDRDNNPYKLDIPYDLSVDGDVEIIFKEYSAVGGFWGVWDLIISDSNEIPEKIVVEAKRDKTEKRIKAKERIVEKKSGLKKKKSKK